MPIYRKALKRESIATIAIEASNQREAQKIFDEWTEDQDSWYEVNEFLSENERDTEEWINIFDNRDSYNRSPIVDDFIVEKPKEKEPLYDMYITYPDMTGRTVFMKCSIDKILDTISALNKDYILKPKGAPDAKAFAEALLHDSTIICFEAERRK